MAGQQLQADRAQENSQLQVVQAGSMHQPKRWPLVQQPSNRSNSFLKDSRLVNAYAEKGIEGYQVEKRPGTAASALVPIGVAAGRGGGIYCFLKSGGPFPLDAATVAVVGNTFCGPVGHAPFNPIFTSIGTIIRSPQINLCKFLQVPSANFVLSYLLVGDGSAGYVYSSDSSFVRITDPNYPLTTVPGFAFLDGTTYVMDYNGIIWGSAGLNNPFVWDPLNFITAQSESDYGVAIAKQLTYVVAFKTWTTMFFYDAGNPTGSPLSPVPGAILNYGCLSADTLQDIDGKLIWVATNKLLAPQVVLMENLQPRVVSTPAIERMLELANLGSSFTSVIIKWTGHTFYCITNLAANTTLVYDLREGLWYQWTDASGNYYQPMSTCQDIGNLHQGAAGAFPLVQNFTTGALFQLGGDYTFPNDAGAIPAVDIYTPNFDDGIDRSKLLSQMRFNADQTAGSQLKVRFSNDDYKTWNNFRTVNLNQVRPYLNDEGSFHRRAYHFRHQANTAFRLRSVDLQMDIGTL